MKYSKVIGLQLLCPPAHHACIGLQRVEVGECFAVCVDDELLVGQNMMKLANTINNSRHLPLPTGVSLLCSCAFPAHATNYSLFSILDLAKHGCYCSTTIICSQLKRFRAIKPRRSPNRTFQELLLQHLEVLIHGWSPL